MRKMQLILSSLVVLLLAVPAFATQSNTNFDSDNYATQSSNNNNSSDHHFGNSQSNNVGNHVGNSNNVYNNRDHSNFNNSQANQGHNFNRRVGREVVKVNLNTVDVKTLVSVLGVSEHKAKAIVAFRNANGNFKSVNDLTKVRGIGRTFVLKHRKFFTVS